MSQLYQLYILNKSGGLVYQREIAQMTKQPLGVNEHVRNGSLLYGIRNITATLCPTLRPGEYCQGLNVFECDGFRLHSFLTESGLTFILLADPKVSDADKFLTDIYVAYADYVAKNPFYEIDQPLRCVKFDAAVTGLVSGKH